MFGIHKGVLITFLLSFCFISFSSAYAVGMSKIEIKGKQPEGVVIHKNKVTVKKGFVFEKISKTKAISRMRGGRGGITGDFDCTCNGTEGGCSVVTTPNSVTCVSSGCNSCYMIVTIPGIVTNILR